MEAHVDPHLSGRVVVVEAEALRDQRPLDEAELAFPRTRRAMNRSASRRSRITPGTTGMKTTCRSGCQKLKRFDCRTAATLIPSLAATPRGSKEAH